MATKKKQSSNVSKKKCYKARPAIKKQDFLIDGKKCSLPVYDGLGGVEHLLKNSYSLIHYIDGKAKAVTHLDREAIEVMNKKFDNYLKSSKVETKENSVNETTETINQK